jgi:hypothetical protein
VQDYHLKVGDAVHRCARGVLSSNAHIINLSLAVDPRVNTQLLISLPLSEVEDTSLKTLRIGAITILGVKVVDNVVRLAGSESLPSDILLLIRHHIGQVMDVRGCYCS